MASGELFRKIQRTKVKASIMIEGLPGSGKSGLALALANVLATDKTKIYAIDTENQSLDLFDKLTLHNGTVVEDMNKVDLTTYAPSNYAELRQAAIDAGGEVIIMDSISHMWNRKGGLLDLVTETQQAGGTGMNNYTAWGTEKNRREKELIFDLIRSDKIHTIVTVRTKEKFGMELGDNGKQKVVSLGEQQIQQEGLKYEPDLVIRMVSAGNSNGKAPVGMVFKSRYAILTPGEEYSFDENLIEQLKQYLTEGIDPEVLLEQQRNEYVEAIKNYCGNNATRKAVWKQLKEDAGYNTPVQEIPISVLKQLYHRLTED